MVCNACLRAFPVKGKAPYPRVVLPSPVVIMAGTFGGAHSVASRALLGVEDNQRSGLARVTSFIPSQVQK